MGEDIAAAAVEAAHDATGAMLKSPPYFLELFAVSFALCFLFGKYCSNEKLWAKWFPESGKDAYEVYAKRGEYGEYELAKKGVTELKGSPFKEPWNAWTSLMYTVFGMVILGTSCMDWFHALNPDAAEAHHEKGISELLPNRQAAYPEFGILYGTSCMWLGVASFMFHASHAEPWRKADAGMTSGVVIAIVVFGLWDRLRPPGLTALGLVLLGVLLQFSLTHGYLPYGSSDALLPSLVGISWVIEFAPRYGGPVVFAEYKNWCAVAYAVLVGLLLRLADVKRENLSLFKKYTLIVAASTVPVAYFLGPMHPIVLFGILGLAWVLRDASRGHIWWHFGSSYALFGWWFMMRTRPGDPLEESHATDTLWATVILFAFIKNACRRLFMALPFPSNTHRERTFFTIEHIVWSAWGWYVLVILPNREDPTGNSSWLYNHEQIWRQPTFPSEQFRLFYMAKTAGAVEDLAYRWIAVFNYNRNVIAAAAAAAAVNEAAIAEKEKQKEGESHAVISDDDAASLIHRSAAKASSPGSGGGGGSTGGGAGGVAGGPSALKTPVQEMHEADLKMDIHHVTTALLCAGSLYGGHTHIGSSIMFVHDLTDVPLDFVRLFGCWNWLNAQALSMFVTLGMWAYWRLWYFPCFLWWSTAYDSKIDVFGHVCKFEGHIWYMDWNCPDPDTGGTLWRNALFVVGVGALVVLHYIWYTMMLRKTYVELWGKRRCKPVRS